MSYYVLSHQQDDLVAHYYNIVAVIILHAKHIFTSTVFIIFTSVSFLPLQLTVLSKNHEKMLDHQMPEKSTQEHNLYRFHHFLHATYLSPSPPCTISCKLKPSSGYDISVCG